MARVSRRSLLKVTGTTAAAATTGGLAGILASGRAPAYAQTSTVHWLKWNDFVPAADEHLRKKAIPEAEKALGIKITLETINANDLQARTTAAIQSKSGADLIMAFNSNCQLYAESLADVTALCEAVGPSQGGYYDTMKGNCHDGKNWISVPYCVIPGLIAYRKSWFNAVGATTFPATWEEYRAVGMKLKAAGHPLGQTLGHTFGDAPGFAYPFMWSFGGKEVEADGKTVAINSKETIESVKFMAGFWKDAHDEGGLAWDDSSNNRAFLSGTIAATLNGASIYIESVRRAAQYMTEDGKEMRTDIAHAPMPRGPGGASAFHGSQSTMVMGYSKNQKAAVDFLRWFHTPANFEPWFTSQKGFASGPTKVWETNKMWDEDPVMKPFRTAASVGRVPGYAGRPNQKAAEALTKYIVVDMYAKAVQGMAAEASVSWAEGELKKIYSV
ncbi:MAG: extracellular solute-binding protein [Acetobacteraceae bacterium]|nr:extracellular solute-binding protein [Acetobacteraceae bacterium]